MAVAEGEETYLGDGLYASSDGFGVKLRAPRLDGDHEVFLEPEMILDLIRFTAKTWPSMKEHIARSVNQ